MEIYLLLKQTKLIERLWKCLKDIAEDLFCPKNIDEEIFISSLLWNLQTLLIKCMLLIKQKHIVEIKALLKDWFFWWRLGIQEIWVVERLDLNLIRRKIFLRINLL